MIKSFNSKQIIGQAYNIIATKKNLEKNLYKLTSEIRQILYLKHQDYKITKFFLTISLSNYSN